MAPINSPLISAERVSAFLAVSTRREFSSWLGISDAQLRFLLYGRQSKARYKKVGVPKANGGTRLLEVPIPFLKMLQRKVLPAIADVVRPSGIAFGYVRGRSILDHAANHAKKNWVINADIEDFFPSIHFGRVRGLFRAPPFSFSDEVATVIAQLCCSDNALPQGAPTSPVLSNLICRSLDRALISFAAKHRLDVSRYSDDICFSTNLRSPPEGLARREQGRFSPAEGFAALLDNHGFKLNQRKFRVVHRSGRQLVTGLVVNTGPQMPRKWRRENRSICHAIRKHGDEYATESIRKWRRKRIEFEPKSASSVVLGRTTYNSEIDLRFKKSANASLLRAYPELSSLIRLAGGLFPIHLITEGKTDLTFLRHAFSNLVQDGKFRGLQIEFSERPETDVGFGDDALKKHLLELVSFNVPKLTIGLFDCDNPRILNGFGLSAGRSVSVSKTNQRVLAACLPKPVGFSGDSFCIEHFFSDSFRQREGDDGRRLFSVGEFDSVSGLHVSKQFYRSQPRNRSLIVDNEVFRTSDGASVALSKAEFCDLVCRGSSPYEDVDWTVFQPVFEFLSELAARPGLN